MHSVYLQVDSSGPVYVGCRLRCVVRDRRRAVNDTENATVRAPRVARRSSLANVLRSPPIGTLLPTEEYPPKI